ncbi:MAG: hypothetical protein UY72_C0035G0011 [Candidatus Uhrbacteria bacterium GW2011_GWD2_52_7]|uniref:Uncharacterized protein n=1 Tax=Candidatus Uhrbacteria bacterium GW2011_GWD2_52_7 TaxID=1618989 RepID=A0A0G1XFJ9_9BACT|nr:MAG: hypothetical protein UY72_C0035G0011 [Candidatus Uhrbacteria bacterium GW2011_GWD2_52_7]
MNKYLAPWELEENEIKQISDQDLRDLVNELFLAEAHDAEMDSTKIVVNAQIKAADGGCDGKTPSSNGSCDYIPPEETCWQLKSGTSGEPSNLKGEVLKKIPEQTLKDGGAYVVIASQSSDSEAEKERRLKVLKDEAANAGIPIDKIRVYGAEVLARWCNKFLPVALKFRNIKPTFITLENFLRAPRFQGEYYETDNLKNQHKDFGERVGAFKSDAFHTHIFGHLGVGKTRFCLESCRQSWWKTNTVFFESCNLNDIGLLLNGIMHREGTKAVIIVDECGQKDIKKLHELAEKCCQNIHLVTIGTQMPSSDIREEIMTLEISPLDDAGLEKYLIKQNPGIPREHVSIIQKFSGGYIKLARVFATSLSKNPSIKSVAELYSSQDILGVMAPLLSEIKEYIPALHVFSLFSGLGVTEPRESEIQKAAKCFGFEDASAILKSTNEVDHLFGIVPTAGHVRYISPDPLATYIAIDALNTHPGILENLIDVFKEDRGALQALLDRIEILALNPNATKTIKKILADFLVLSDFNNPTKARVWKQLNVADPVNAATNLEMVLSSASLDERRAIAGNARRDLVWGLESLVREKESFHPAIKALAHLAIAENETWANNATGNFTAHYQILLGGTSVPYLERLEIFDEIVALGSDYRVLIVKALAVIAQRQFVGHWDGGRRATFGNEDWQPKTRGEEAACILAAFKYTNKLIDSGEEVIGIHLASTLSEIIATYYRTDLIDEVDTLVKRFVEKYPQQAEGVRKSIQQIIRGCRIRKEEKTPAYLRLVTIHKALSGDEFTERLRTFVGAWSIDVEDSDKTEVEKLAGEFLAEPTLIEKHYEWMVSGEANSVWGFAKHLGRLDVSEMLFEFLWSKKDDFSKKDVRLLAGYMDGRMTVLGSDWLIARLEELQPDNNRDATLIIQLVWRLLPDHRGAKYILDVLERSTLPSEAYGTLIYGRWALDIDIKDFKQIMAKLIVVPGLRPLAISLLGQRVSGEKDLIKDSDIHSFSLNLITDKDLITERHGSYVYDWESLTELFIASETAALINAIVEAHDNKVYWAFIGWKNTITMCRC